MISQIVLAAGLIIVILIQQSDGDSLSGIGGNNMNSAISKQTATSLLGKITFGLIIIFFLNSLALGSIAKFSNQKLQEDLEKVIEEQDSKTEKPASIPDNPDDFSNSGKKNSKDTKPSKVPLIPSVE